MRARVEPRRDQPAPSTKEVPAPAGVSAADRALMRARLAAMAAPRDTDDAVRDDKPTPRAGSIADRINRLSANPRLGHQLGVNSLFVDLAAYARSTPGASLDRWWSERRCQDITGDLAHPDGHGVWTEAGRTVSWWLEYDNGP